MKTLLAVLALATLTTGCISMGTKRSSGGGQIQRTAAPDYNPLMADQSNVRPDLGER